MLVEVLVFRRKESLHQQWRHGFDGLEQAPFPRELAEQRAVGGVDTRRDRRLVVLEHGIVRQLGGHRRQIGCGNAHDREGREHAKAEKPAQQAKHQALVSRRIERRPTTRQHHES